MKAETLRKERPTVKNSMDDTRKTRQQLIEEGGATEALADALTDNLKGVSDQSLQVNENLLSFREEVLDEFTVVHGENKDIHHNAASNYQKLDAKIDGNFQKLDAKIDGNYQKLDAKIDDNYQKLDAKIDGNYQKLDAKIDGNYQKLDAKIDKNQLKLEADLALVRKELASTNQEVTHTRETLTGMINSTRETLTGMINSTRETLSIQMDAKFAQAQNYTMRWNIGLFIGITTMFIGLAGLMITLDRPL
ncbi:MAG: hypothetical protein OXC05_00645 [Halieaceae bacterium]|nr:hypothetical protein [Halieaceae bacterium]